MHARSQTTSQPQPHALPSATLATSPPSHLPLPSPRSRSQRRSRVLWLTTLSLMLILLLAACGGDDDDDDDTDTTPATNSSSIAITPSVGSAPSGGGAGTTPAAMPGSTPASMPGAGAGSTEPAAADATEPAAAEVATEPAAAEPTATTAAAPSGSNSGDGGTVPTQASTDFPDVHVPLTVGSSGEVGATGASDLSDSPEKHPLRATLVSIIDPATIDSVVYTNDPGLRYVAFEMKLEALGDAPVSTGIWTLGTTDGQVYDNLMLTGVGEDIFYGDVQPGTSQQGVLVYQIPEDATIEWLFLSPHIYVGGNLIFIAP